MRVVDRAETERYERRPMPIVPRDEPAALAMETIYGPRRVIGPVAGIGGPVLTGSGAGAAAT